MIRAIVLAALVPSIAVAQGEQFNFPRETGAVARRDDGSTSITVFRIPMAEMQVLPGGCKPPRNTITIGCSIWGNSPNGRWCSVYVPLEAGPEDAAYIELHERRHCLGQNHEEITGPDGSTILRWLP